MRVTTRLVSTILAALLAVASLVTLAELALAALGRDAWLVDWRAAETFGQQHAWDDAAVRLVAVAAIVAGVVLLVAALRPRRPVVLDSDAGTEHVRLRIRTRSLERHLDRELAGLDGVDTATTRWSRRGFTVRATSPRTETRALEEAVRNRASEVLTGVGITSGRPRVHLRSTAAAASVGPAIDRPHHDADGAPSVAEAADPQAEVHA